MRFKFLKGFRFLALLIFMESYRQRIKSGDDPYLHVNTERLSANMRSRSGSNLKLSPPVAWGTPRYLSTRAVDDSFIDTSMEDDNSIRADNDLHLWVFV